MSEYNTDTDLVEQFIQNYDEVIRSLRPTFKSKTIDPYNYESLELINEELILLITVTDANRTDELPRYMIYNILLLAKLALRHYDTPLNYKPLASLINIIKKNYQILKENTAIQDKLVRRK